MKPLSAYTIAKNCTDITDVTYGVDEIKEAVQRRLKSGKRVPSYYYIRLFHLKNKLVKFEHKERINTNRKTISELSQSKIVELSSKLAEHDLMVHHQVSQDILFDKNGNYHAKYQDEFCNRYDDYYNDLISLLYGK